MTGNDSGGFDPDLNRLVPAWPELDDTARRRILKINPPQYQVGQAFQPDVRLESLTYDEFLAGGC